jgi:hypothetical protein
MVVKGLIDRDAACVLTLTEHGRAALTSLLRAMRANVGNPACLAVRTAVLTRAALSRGLARLSSTVFRFAVSATVAYPALDVAYDGLPTVIYMNMLDANVLLSAVTQPSKNL